MKVIICWTSNPRSKKFLKKLHLISRWGSWGRQSSRALPGITPQARTDLGIQSRCVVSFPLPPSKQTTIPVPSLYSYSGFLAVVGNCSFWVPKVPKQSRSSYLNLWNSKMPLLVCFYGWGNGYSTCQFLPQNRHSDKSPCSRSLLSKGHWKDGKCGLK